MKAGICPEKRRLSEQLQVAVNALTSLQTAQGNDLIAGGSGLPGFQLALKDARAKWEQARRHTGRIFENTAVKGSFSARAEQDWVGTNQQPCSMT